MSKPRSKWWGYVRNILYAYPAMVKNPERLTSMEERERDAVDSAMVETLRLPDGESSLDIIRMVFYQRSHTLCGAAMHESISYRTARRRQNDFIRCVGKYMGLS